MILNLTQLLKLLEAYPTPFIRQKMLLARRLAQCLNPSLPYGVHEKVVQVYSVVFKHLSLDGMSWAADLPGFTMGLLPFFKSCTLQSKMELMQLIQTHYLPLGEQLTPALPALIPSILLMYEENDETISKAASVLIEKISDVSSGVSVDRWEEVCQRMHLHGTSENTKL